MSQKLDSFKINGNFGTEWVKVARVVNLKLVFTD